MKLRYSKQRSAIWNFIKDRTDHPTADVVFRNVREAYPNISLGTVYRNLMLLRDLGELRTIEVGDGLTHFDPNTCEHSHFVCSTCGRVIDLMEADVRAMCGGISESFPGRITGCTAVFHGECEDCCGEKENS